MQPKRVGPLTHQPAVCDQVCGGDRHAVQLQGKAVQEQEGGSGVSWNERG